MCAFTLLIWSYILSNHLTAFVRLESKEINLPCLHKIMEVNMNTWHTFLLCWPHPGSRPSSSLSLWFTTGASSIPFTHKLYKNKKCMEIPARGNTDDSRCVCVCYQSLNYTAISVHKLVYSKHYVQLLFQALFRRFNLRFLLKGKLASGN